MDYKVLLNFDNKNTICKNINFEDDIRIIDIFQNIINNKNNDYFFTKDGILINPNDKLYCKSQSINNFINIECHRKLKGGGILDAILDVIFGVFNPIVKPIVAVGNAFLFLIDALVYMVKFIIWLIQFILWLLFDLLNPKNFLTEFYKTLMLIVVAICKLPFDIFIAITKIGFNTIAGWMQGFWGWDMSNLTKNDKNSPYFKSFDKIKGQKVYYTNSNTVPFSIILGTILCPPMGVFMDLGLSGWLNIIVCALLTLMFYIPGLCYALLIIYS
jgi:uncharacterized membrane protein YqaE (UPF0057 family)